MPEGDTIFRTARTLRRALVGAQVSGFSTSMAEPTRAQDERSFLGQYVLSVESRGKWLLIVFGPEADSEESAQRVLATHMLMSGSWHVYPIGATWQKPREQARILVETEGCVAAAFRVSIAKIYTWEKLRRERKIPRRNEDLLQDEFDSEAALVRLMAHRSEMIGEAIVKQRVMAGVGNVFKSEVCFAEGVSPFARVDSLSEQQLRNLIARARQQLKANVMEDSGNQIVTYRGLRRRTTRSADPGANLWVYGRRDEPCRRCGAGIARALQGEGARVTYWCPQCQPVPVDAEL